MVAGEDKPTQADGPDGAHVRVQEVVELLRSVPGLHHGVDREDAERHQNEGQRPQDNYLELEYDKTKCYFCVNKYFKIKQKITSNLNSAT